MDPWASSQHTEAGLDPNQTSHTFGSHKTSSRRRNGKTSLLVVRGFHSRRRLTRKVTPSGLSAAMPWHSSAVWVLYPHSEQVLSQTSLTKGKSRTFGFQHDKILGLRHRLGCFTSCQFWLQSNGRAKAKNVVDQQAPHLLASHAAKLRPRHRNTRKRPQEQ